MSTPDNPADLAADIEAEHQPDAPQGLARLIPPAGLVQTLSVQSALWGLGGGAFNTASAVFYTQRVGLSAAQVGAGLSIMGVVFIVTAYPAGLIVDRLGAKRLWALGAVVAGLLLLSWPFIHSFTWFIVMLCLDAFINSVSNAARMSYQLDVLPADVRIKSQAYFYSFINLGFSLGALVGGVALAFNSDTALVCVPIFFAAITFINAWRITLMPKSPNDLRTDRKEHAHEAAAPATSISALRNVPFMVTSFFFGVTNSHDTLLNTVIPLWLVTQTDAPHWLLAWLFATNTVLCVFLPQYTAAAIRTPAQGRFATRMSLLFFVASCLITMTTHSTVGWVTAVLVWIGHGTVTGAELYWSGAVWVVEVNMTDPQRRGQYQGLNEAFGGLGSVWTPALFTFLAMGWHAHNAHIWGWLIIAAIVAIAAIALHPATRAAERFARRHFPEALTPEALA